MTAGGEVATWRVLLVCGLAAFMAFLDSTIVNIAFPVLQRAFPSDSQSNISWVLNAYNVVFAALLVPAGRMADRFGRRRSFLLGLIIFTAASAGCAFSPSITVLIGMRMFQALGAAILIPTGIALLLPTYPPGKQIKAIALIAAASGVAFAAGPTIGGSLIEASSWRSIFLINLPIGALTLLLSYRVLVPDQRARDNRLPDLVGAASVLVGVGLLALALVQGGTWGWGDGRVVLSFVGAGALLSVAIWRSLGHPSPVIELGLFRRSQFRVANLSVLAFGIGLAAKLLCDVLFMTSVWGYSEFETGLAVSPSPLITAVVASLGARLAIRFGSRAIAVTGGLLYGGGCLWYVLNVGTAPAYLSEYLPGTVLTGVGIALILPTVTTAAVTAVPERLLALGAGINAMVRQLGAVLGVALFVAIVGTPTPTSALTAFHRGWALAAIAALVAALASLGLPRSHLKPATGEIVGEVVAA
jgi:EmrB/QacA subfamily drug resistance transporter